jgi:hypothetical protein
MAKRPDRTPPQLTKGEDFELADEDLELVVGGLSPEASIAYALFLKEATGRDSQAYRLDRLRKSGVWKL